MIWFLGMMYGWSCPTSQTRAEKKLISFWRRYSSLMNTQTSMAKWHLTNTWRWRDRFRLRCSTRWSASCTTRCHVLSSTTKWSENFWLKSQKRECRSSQVTRLLMLPFLRCLRSRRQNTSEGSRRQWQGHASPRFAILEPSEEKLILNLGLIFNKIKLFKGILARLNRYICSKWTYSRRSDLFGRIQTPLEIVLGWTQATSSRNLEWLRWKNLWYLGQAPLKIQKWGTKTTIITYSCPNLKKNPSPHTNWTWSTS